MKQNTLYIHIGMPKTGSSAIQAFLKINYELILKKGYSYPNPPKFEQSYQTSGGNGVPLAKSILNNDMEKARQFIDSLSPDKDIILSSEALFDCIRLYPERFFSLIKDFNYKIICYVRRQDDQFSSAYKQAIKNHNAKDSDVLSSIKKSRDFHSILMNCLNYTTANNILVRPYEKTQFINRDIYTDFLHNIGIDFESNFTLPNKVVNPSLDFDTLEFRRILNILEIDEEDKGLKYQINSLLAKYTVYNNNGEPFQNNSVFSSEERLNIINSYDEKNNEVARVFLNRSDGKLFYEPKPEIDKISDQKRKLTFEKAKDISEFLLSSNLNEIDEKELIKSLAKGVISQSFFQKPIELVDFRKKRKLYILNSEPKDVSQDVKDLQKKYGFWYIESAGNDPYFTIPEFSTNNDGEIFVKIEITASNNTVLQLFYIAENKHFNQNFSVSKKIKKGFNELIIKIRENHPIEALRLDPSNSKGVYLLHHFEVRKEENT